MMNNFAPNEFEAVREDTLRRQKEALASVRVPSPAKADKARDKPRPRKSGQYPPTTKGK
jgi:hypothetical protein